MKKIRSIVCVMLIMLVFGLNNVYAVLVLDEPDGSSHNAGDSHWIDTNEYNPTVHEYSADLMIMARTIMGYITVIGMVVSVIVLSILGLKYMTGSVEEKAEFKKDMFPYIIGAVFTFGASSIAQLIYQLTNSVF